MCHVLPLIQTVLGKAQRHQALTLVTLAVLFTLVGGTLFSITQAVSLFTGIYWAITTATTVGYGDITPKNTIGRLIAAGVMLTAIPLFASLFAVIAASLTAQEIRKVMGLDKRVPRDGYVLIIGSGPLVRQTIEDLNQAGRSCVVVAESRPGELDGLEESVRLISGSPLDEDTLKKAHPERAQQILITAEKDSDVLLCTVLTKHLAPNVSIIAVVTSRKVAQAISDLGVDIAFSSEELLGHTLAKSLEAPHASEVISKLLGSENYELLEEAVIESNVGRRLSEIRDESRDLILGVATDAGVSIGVDEDPVLSSNNHLVLIRLRDSPKRR